METYRQLFEKGLLQFDAYNELQQAERKYLRGNINYCAERCADMAKAELTQKEKQCLRSCVFNLTEVVKEAADQARPNRIT